MMKKAKKYVAADFGASCGKISVGRFEGRKLAIEEIRRFDNAPIRLHDTLYWGFPRLFHELCCGFHPFVGPHAWEYSLALIAGFCYLRRHEFAVAHFEAILGYDSARRPRGPVGRVRATLRPDRAVGTRERRTENTAEPEFHQLLEAAFFRSTVGEARATEATHRKEAWWAART